MTVTHREVLVILTQSKIVAQQLIATKGRGPLSSEEQLILSRVKQVCEAGWLKEPGLGDEAGLSLEELAIVIGMASLQGWKLNQ